ncbi:patatin-like phospholipase family protein [Phaeodactylibacter sp.]|jgi:NTE family protein|uniref:patatin-like phospholipase family protein n=1 Tax=Phaeodactylibacter sp. TaxID=1940289 RepID=UPI0025CE8BC8|nr:patatin-like phospholipase family protein [Phaeodactylibacter sp.]MCI4648373.1 patatin-like phospholipase family protein [Phaeodactylibacter sp.]MCI5094567.1 patatin-like phospholipase family protein [Phaeodactylibacter sp.]
MEQKKLALALQGGGSHGAITWGVLDRLLEEEHIDLEGFSGTSAGAMNAAVLAYGLHISGREKAKSLLDQFWRRVAEAAALSPVQPAPWDLLFGGGNMDYSPGFMAAEAASMFVSPYQFNPMGLNPLRDILADIVDFEALRHCNVTQLFVCATNVRRGRAKVFDLPHISVDAVMASACLPEVFKAVTIDGEDYWDGGFMGNPPIYPLLDAGCQDILLVQINPINIDRTPQTSSEIRDRVNELSFNSSLMLEMRRIAFVDKLLSAGVDLGAPFHKVFIHHINPEAEVQGLNLSSKLNANWQFLLRLKAIGREKAEAWLAQHSDQVGVASSCNIRETFL